MNGDTTTLVKPLTADSAPEAARPVLKAVEQKFGKVLNIFGTMAHQPDVLKGAVSINEGIQNDLSPKLREMAYFKASQMNGCEYCSTYHKKAASDAGVSDEQFRNIDNYAGSDAFDDQEKAILSYVEQLTKDADVTDTVRRQVSKFLDEKQLVALAATVALANFTNRFNHALGIQLP